MTNNLKCPLSNLIKVKFIGFWDNIIFCDTDKPLSENSGLIIDVDGVKTKFTHREWENFKHANKGYLLCNGTIH